MTTQETGVAFAFEDLLARAAELRERGGPVHHDEEAGTWRVLDEVDGASRVDIVDALAYPLPIIVIAELLGVPVADRPLFTRWAQVLFSGDQLGESADMEDIQRALDAIAPTIREMNAYILDHIRHHRAHPGPGLTSRLVEAEFNGERLEDEEIVGFVALLLIAGHITTTALLGNAV